MSNETIVTACFGDQETNIQRLLTNIRRLAHTPDELWPVIILTTEDSNIGDVSRYLNVRIEYVERLFAKGSIREGVRNSNYHKIRYALSHTRRNYVLLDADMFICHKDAFLDGFRIADRFGLALPLNPRTYVKYNAMGADVGLRDWEEIEDTPLYAPAANFSPFFISMFHQNSQTFLYYLEQELGPEKVCRGTLALWKAAWKTGVTPVYLPEHWCVCASNAANINRHTEQIRGENLSIPPVMLHLGHDEVRREFGL